MNYVSPRKQRMKCLALGSEDGQNVKISETAVIFKKTLLT
jgi:hypothetical protein